MTTGATSGDVDGVHAGIETAPTEFDYRHTSKMHYELTFSAGANDERFAIIVEPPRFPGGEGSPFLPPPTLDVGLSGPATRGFGQNTFASMACSKHDVMHGADLTTLTRDVAAPAGTTSTLSVTFGVSRRDAPFSGQQVRPTFRLTPRLVSMGDGPATITRDLVLAPRAPTVVGPTGVRILMRTKPRTARLGGPPPAYQRGQTVTVLGRTRPRLSRQLIELRTLGPRAESAPRRVARIRTDRRGGFRYRWQPRGIGRHELFASYRRQQRGVTNDRACPIALRITNRQR